eukprot:125918-Chlamydomonas_euryale.AAC.1
MGGPTNGQVHEIGTRGKGFMNAGGQPAARVCVAGVQCDGRSRAHVGTRMPHLVAAARSTDAPAAGARRPEAASGG